MGEWSRDNFCVAVLQNPNVPTVCTVWHQNNTSPVEISVHFCVDESRFQFQDLRCSSSQDIQQMESNDHLLWCPNTQLISSIFLFTNTYNAPLHHLRIKNGGVKLNFWRYLQIKSASADDRAISARSAKLFRILFLIPVGWYVLSTWVEQQSTAKAPCCKRTCLQNCHFSVWQHCFRFFDHWHLDWNSQNFTHLRYHTFPESISS